MDRDGLGEKVGGVMELTDGLIEDTLQKDKER